jgi:leucyl aminopeptidase (aminopeptidase T)
MFNADNISLLNTEALAVMVKRDFGNASLEAVERDFVEFVTSGVGAYEDYSSWRQAWRDFVEFCNEEEAVEVTTEDATVVGFAAAGFPLPVLNAQNQISLF